ncbi:MAG: methylenetetrahydrofolate reductase C-terminal domain-containing protein [Thermodesulfobacteriota bacterium]
MIVGERKPLEEIQEMLQGHQKVLNIGCGGCTSICLSGGQREVMLLNDDLRNVFQGNPAPIQLGEFTIERQCNADFFSELDEMVKDYDAILSMACGAGVQFVADRYPDKPVFPALNTIFVGTDREIGWYEENCRTCGNCILGETAGICPVTRCAKSLFNGPCGGTSRDGKCEVSKETPCAWYEIYDRLKRQGRLSNITKVSPAREWRNQTRRSLIHEAYKQRYAK